MRIAVIDDETVTVRRLVHILKKAGYEPLGYTSGAEFMAQAQEIKPDLALLDVHLADADGVDLMQRLKELCPGTPVILITGYATVSQAVQATKQGAFHYLEKPFKIAELLAVVAEAVNSLMPATPVPDLAPEGRLDGMIGSAPAMQTIFATIRRIAPVDCNVLILGESGTGKELVARSLHQRSHRASCPFVSFNCGAFTAELIANELFGHERGAFTGAATDKPGLLETASGGTVFLDEVGEMPLAMQIKLLRVLQEYSFLRVGGIKPIAIDVRFIAATNRALAKMVAAGEFRQDFYYRLKVVSIDLPPLRDRRQDIPALATHFTAAAARRYGKAAPDLAPDFLDPLLGYPFPGNIRELEHIIERAVALTNRPRLERRDLPPDLFIAEPVPMVTEGQDRPTLRDKEKEHILEVYQTTGYNQVQTARALGISRTTLWRRLHAFGIMGPSPKE